MQYTDLQYVMNIKIKIIMNIKIKILCNVGCLRTRSDLECSSPAFDKHDCCENTKGTHHM